jgi:hypothetical protein
MPRATPIQSSFNGGEISDLMAGRVDVKRYSSGLAVCENFHILVPGPIRRRSGTRYVANTGDPASPSDVVTRLQPFIYSTETAYVLAFSDLRVDFYKDEAALIPDATVVTPYLAAELFELNFTQSADVLYIAHKNHQWAKLSRTSLGPPEVWLYERILTDDGPYEEINTDESSTIIIADHSVGPASTLVTAVDPIFSPFDADSNPGVSNDGRLIRMRANKGTVWTVARIIDYLDTDEVLVVVLRSGNGLYINEAGVPQPIDQWRLGAWDRSAASGYPATVTFYQNRILLAGSIRHPETIWASVTGDFETFSPTDDVDADEGVTKSLSNVLPDSAYTFTMAAGYTGQVNTVRWLAPARDCIVGTTGGISTLSSDQTGPITPFNVFVRESNTFGSNIVQPVRVEDFVIYISHTARKIRGVGYNFNDDNYVSEDLTVIAEGILEGGSVQISFQKEPHGVVWVAKGNGELISMTLDRTQKVAGFSRHHMGGAMVKSGFTDLDVTPTNDPPTADDNTIADMLFSEGDGPIRLSTVGTLPGGLRDDVDYWVHRHSATLIKLARQKGGTPVRITDPGGPELSLMSTRAHVESVCSIPATLSGSDHDQVWFVVARDIGGSTVRHIEFMDQDFEVSGDREQGFFVDSGKTFSGGPYTLTPVNELDHLVGETVQVLGDGAYQGTRVVDVDGQVVVDPAATVVSVGLGYESNMQSNNFEIQTFEGTSQGKKSRMHNVTVRFDSTVEAEAGPDEENLVAISFREPEDLMNESPPIFTGDRRIETQDDWNTESKIFIRQKLPFPMTIVALMPWFDESLR